MNHTTINVKVLPRSSKDEIVERQDDTYKIKLTAPAIEGKANKALLKLLAKRCSLPKTRIEIVSGERSRTKSIRITGLTLEQVDKRLLDYIFVISVHSSEAGVRYKNLRTYAHSKAATIPISEGLRD
ncbi:MAG: YggU family protein [Deltaproteobacteria bacterium]|nr:YggU family protein [Deltaproteobacteria bacterium]